MRSQFLVASKFERMSFIRRFLGFIAQLREERRRFLRMNWGLWQDP